MSTESNYGVKANLNGIAANLGNGSTIENHTDYAFKRNEEDEVPLEVPAHRFREVSKVST